MTSPNNKAPNKVGQNAPTTGHSWDGIEEYNNPLPRWWLWSFLICVVFAAGYVVYYPSWPTFFGIGKWSSVGRLNVQLDEAKAQHAASEQKLASMTPQQIDANPDARTYAIQSGKVLFALNCSQCHGAGGAGNKGFPNLTDDEWIHGGALSDIAKTITHGIRDNTDPATRDLAGMTAFGKDGILQTAQIEDVVNYLSVIGKGAPENESSKRGAAVFAENCTVCHGEKAEGNREMGAPPLANDIWLYGGTHADRVETITNGRAGMMPTFAQKLSPQDVNKLAVYVHSLGGGEAEKPAAPVAPAADASATTVSDTAPAAAPAPAEAPKA